MKCLLMSLLILYRTNLIQSFDATIIYRLDDEDTSITDNYIEIPQGEVHIRTNALGLFPQAQFYDRFNDIAENDFPDCISFMDSCEWKGIGWSQIISSSCYGTVSTEDDDCINNKITECHHIQHGIIIKSQKKLGTLRFPSHSSKSEYISTEYRQNITLELNDTYSEKCDDFKVTIYDKDINYGYYSDSDKIIEFYGYEHKIFTASPIYWIEAYVENNCPYPLEIDWYHDPFAMNKTVYKLSERAGYAKSPLFTTRADLLCIGLSYDVEHPDDISVLEMDVLLYKMDGTYEIMTEINTHNHQKSFYKKFFLQLDEHNQGVPLSIKVKVTVKEGFMNPGFYMKRIEKCDLLNTEEIILLNKTYIPLDYFNLPRLTSPDKECINGGVWNAEEETCNCPAGFIGKHCEEGCGENLYGDDCSATCSALVDKCSGLLMCKYGLQCHCAPGFKGQFCNISCDEGEYGAGCSVKCGHCLHGYSCDPYTGACNSGCEEGYHSPLCYYRYKHLTSAPRIVSSDYNSLTMEVNFNSTTGVGTSRYYQVQYKEKNSDSWEKGQTKLIPEDSDNDTAHVSDLKTGIWYDIRVVLIDKDLNSYQGEDIPVTLAQTLCLVPNEVVYKIESQEINFNDFQITWQYNPDKSITCPFHNFEVYVKEQWRWLLYWKGTDSKITLNNILPGNTFYVKVRAITVNGPAHFSDSTSVTTKINGPGTIRDILMPVFEPYRIGLVWTPPKTPAGTISSYIVTYQCKKLLGCPEEDCSHIKGSFSVLMPKATISGLVPHAQYRVSISAVSDRPGPEVVTTVATDQAVPGVAPAAALKPISHRTNTSFSVFWKGPLNCRTMNGFFSHFEYQLLESSEHAQNDYAILEGSTTNTSVTFNNLKLHSRYVVKVYVATSAGINASNPLVIMTETKAGVPGKVEELTVYKKGRKIIGLRWARPKSINGKLHSFSISYQKKGSSDVNYKEIKPTHCSGWQHLYCHTITGLSADTEYIVSVSARNSEIAEDGDKTIEYVLTKEEAPGIPTHLKVSNQTDTSITVQWKLPHMLNGVLRSFLITIEQTDSHNSSDCCQDFPFQTLSATHEQLYYTYQFTDLSPASTYTISVSAKTTLIGPAIVSNGNTKPPKPDLEGAIKILSHASLKSGIQLELTPVNQYQHLIRKGLLILLPQNDSIVLDTIHEPEITEESLINELLEAIEEPFYLIAELPQNVLRERSEIFLSTTATSKNALHFHIEEQLIVSGAKYRLGLVLVLQYCDVYNLAYTITPEFLVN